MAVHGPRLQRRVPAAPPTPIPRTLQVYLGSGLNSARDRAPYLVHDLRITTASRPGRRRDVVIDTDFEVGLDGPVPRDDGPGNAAPRGDQQRGARRHPGGAGLQPGLTGRRTGHNVTTVHGPGCDVRLHARVRFADGQGDGAIWLSPHITSGAAVVQHGGPDSRRHRRRVERVSARYLMSGADPALLYFETTSRATGTPRLPRRRRRRAGPRDPDIEDLMPINETTSTSPSASRSTPVRPPARPPPSCAGTSTSSRLKTI